MTPSLRELTEKLTTENQELKERVEKWSDLPQKLAERIEKLEAAQEVFGLEQSETLVRVESVEENLCDVKPEQQEIRDDQANMMLRLVSHEMYSRKQTLFVTGEAVRDPTR